MCTRRRPREAAAAEALHCVESSRTRGTAHVLKELTIKVGGDAADTVDDGLTCMLIMPDCLLGNSSCFALPFAMWLGPDNAKFTEFFAGKSFDEIRELEGMLIFVDGGEAARTPPSTQTSMYCENVTSTTLRGAGPRGPHSIVSIS